MNFEIYEVYPNGIREPIPPMAQEEVLIVMPATDLSAAVLSMTRIMAFAGMPSRAIIIHDFIRQGFIKSVNMCAKELKPAYLAYIAQDALAGRDWLKFSWQAIGKTSAGVCALNDGKFGGRLASFGLVKTDFTNALYGEGMVFCEAYSTHRADDELTNIAHLSGRLCYDPRALMLEVDYRMQRPLNRQDVLIYEKRKPQFPAMAEAVRGNNLISS